MADEPQANINPETPTQETPMPSVEQKTPTEEVHETTSQETTGQETETEGLPESAKERTRKEFEKLQDKYKDERSKRLYYEGVFNSLKTKPQEQPAPIYDPETGLLNEGALTQVQKEAREAKERATKAEEALYNYLDFQEKQETFKDFPELNPDAKGFDKELHKATRAVLQDSMLNPDDYDGKQLTFKEAAALAKSRSSAETEKAKKEGAQEALEKLTPKEQASLEAMGAPARRTTLDNSNIEDLRRRTRKGDMDALVERLE